MNTVVQKKWILLVDDDPDIRQLMREHITEKFDERIRFIEAKDGGEANLKLINQAFDLIITDLQMPNVDGQHFIEFVKQSALNESTPIIVVTGFPDNDLFSKHDEIAHIDKPYSKEQLTMQIETQFKLGRLDQRVDAEVVNTFIKASGGFAKRVMDGEATFHEPVIKKSGQAPKGDVLCMMNIISRHGSCRLGIGLDERFINNLLEKFHSKASKVKLVESAVNVVFKSTQQFIHQSTGDTPVLKERVVISTPDGFDYNQVLQAKGIIIPIETEFGTIFAHSLSLKNSSEKLKAS